ncbi:MAG: histidine phosphatase family protein [Myxococcales bacterium]|nr:histidine phosphatase family protein [Myxococcales bacterium]
MRILYVDSRTRLARAACRDLPHDTDVILVATAAEAERAARHGQFDAVIADYDLPGVNGSELVRRLREAGLAAPVVALAGHDLGARAMRQAGADAVCGQADFATLGPVLGRLIGASVRRVTLIRHGESEWNAAGRWQGQGDAALSDRGRQQADALAARLDGRPIARLEHSDLQRAAHTAAALGRGGVAEPAWRELAVGAWEGLTDAEVGARFPDEVAAVRRGEAVRLGGGEDWPTLEGRVVAAFARLVGRLGPGEEGVVVCHGGVIVGLVTALLGLTRRLPRTLGRPGNTSLTTLEVGPSSTRLVVYNDATHLPPTERARAGAVEVRLARDVDLLGGRPRVDGVTDALRLEARPRVGFSATPGILEATARAALAPNGDGTARLGPSLPGRVGHVILHRQGRTLWDWNIEPEEDEIAP